MRTHRHPWIGLAAAGALAALLPALLVIGCNGEENKTPPAQPEVDAAFANVRCPIMGSTIDPEKVTDDLTRTYKGQKIAFCCGGCPSAWDKLSEAEKDAKLAAAIGTKSP